MKQNNKSEDMHNTNRIIISRIKVHQNTWSTSTLYANFADHSWVTLTYVALLGFGERPAASWIPLHCTSHCCFCNQSKKTRRDGWDIPNLLFNPLCQPSPTFVVLGPKVVRVESIRSWSSSANRDGPTKHDCTDVNPAGDAGDTSPPIFWLGVVNGNIPQYYYVLSDIVSWTDWWLGSGRHLHWPRLARRRDLSQGWLCVTSVGSLDSSYTAKVAVDVTRTHRQLDGTV